MQLNFYFGWFTELKNKKQPRYQYFVCFLSHGTRCAGEVSAARDNQVCGVGVAYDSKVAGKTLHSSLYVFNIDRLFIFNTFELSINSNQQVNESYLQWSIVELFFTEKKF